MTLHDAYLFIAIGANITASVWVLVQLIEWINRHKKK